MEDSTERVGALPLGCALFFSSWLEQRVFGDWSHARAPRCDGGHPRFSTFKFQLVQSLSKNPRFLERCLVGIFTVGRHAHEP